MPRHPEPPEKPQRRLTLFDAACIIVGIIIGSGIYETTPLITQCVTGPWALIGVWALGGLIALVGALCYAELTTAFPREGGCYVFLTQAYGPRMGFLFAWSEFWIVRPGNIGMMTYIFARFATKLQPLGLGVGGSYDFAVYASAAIIVLTTLNVAGVQTGKWTQNLLTSIKVCGLLAVIAIAFLPVSGPTVHVATASSTGPGNFRLALILVLFAYGGWNEVSYVAAEVRKPRKNLLRALVIGVVAVSAIYILINVAFVYALGFEGVRQSAAVPSDVVEQRLGIWGSRATSLLICVSCIGAAHGMIFTGSRIYYALGREHRWYALLGQWGHQQAPTWSLALQGVISLGLVVAVGSEAGFERLLWYTTPIFWTFFTLAGLSLFVLRVRQPDLPRPYRVAGYPVVPALFCASSIFILYASLSYAWENKTWEAFVSIGVLAIGFIVSLVESRFAPPVVAGDAQDEKARS